MSQQTLNPMTRQIWRLEFLTGGFGALGLCLEDLCSSVFLAFCSSVRAMLRRIGAEDSGRSERDITAFQGLSLSLRGVLGFRVFGLGLRVFLVSGLGLRA